MTGVDAHAQNAAQLFGAERQEGLEGDGQVCTDLQAGVQDGGRTVEVGLGNLPRLGVGDVFVADTGDIHRLFQGLAEVETVEVFLQRLAADGNLREGFGINGFRLGIARDAAAEIFLCEHRGAIDKIAEDGHELAVVAGLEIFPGEVIVFRLGRIGRERVPQYVLLAGELLFEFIHPDGPAP